ncbi:Ribosome biogenesis protein nsa1 (NOP7-associated protein 1) [Coemansia pectinata]|uniref:Ribosome biogenesis protein nsa1 (NOP7-associated protein 1) n=1 Tax=Coemansia pectinata TaxID=1052879 RepID=A0A9W8GPP0_9FUNG|nr:Ribosome biogenesis protein nsa1 (NOP7-associated protein 1) [Coemansia pectinata]
MRFYTSDETGQIKGVDVDSKVSLLEAQIKAAKKVRADAKAKANAKKGEVVVTEDNILAGTDVWNLHGAVNRDLAIQHMYASSWKTGEPTLVVARKNGAVEVVSKDSGESLYTFGEPEFAAPFSIKSNGRTISDRRYVGIGATDSHFITATNMGEVRYQSYDEQSDVAATLLRLQIDACKMRVHDKRASVFAIGGREQELTVWDAETAKSAGSSTEFSKPSGAPIFKSKNVCHDFLDMRVPVWITDMQFIGDNTTNPTIAISTGYKQIRIYDAKAKQRPVHDWEVSKHPINHILVSHAKPELFFADNEGNLQKMDLRTGRIIGGYKGIAGAVKAISLSEDGTKVAAAGLDRFLRVYEADGMHRMLHRAYIKQRVSQVVWDWEHRDVNQEEIDQRDADSIWESMPKLETSIEPKKKGSSKRKAIAVSED